MQILSLVLRVVALVGALLAGVGWFLTQGKLDDLQRQLQASRASASSLQSQLTEANETIEDQTISIKALQGDLADAKRRTSRAQTDFNEARQQLAQVRNQLEDTRQERDTLQRDNENLRQEILEATTGPATGPEPGSTLADDDRAAYESQIADLKDQISDLSEELADTQAALVDARNAPAATASRGNLQVAAAGEASGTGTSGAPAVSARIAGLDRKLGLLVLDVGSRQGLSSTGEYTLRQGGMTVGRARVRTLQPDMSVLALLPGIGMPDALRKGDSLRLSL
jgi:predicted nuclease with TOPRIM domain